MRKELPMLIGVLAGLAVIFGQYTALGQGWGIVGYLNRWFQVSFATAFAVGAVNLTVIHVRNIQRRRSTWIGSIAMLLALYGYAAITLAQTVEGPTAAWIFDGMLVPLNATLYGLVIFYIMSAAYRAFRIRTLEATALMIAAVLVMLGSAPIGETITPLLGTVKDWLTNVPVTTAYRGIEMGAYIGGFATALRILLGLERAHMGAN